MLFRLFDSVQARRGGPEFNTAKASTISLTNNIEAEALGFLGTFARVGSVLKHELRIAIAELTRETPPHPHRRIDRHLRRAAFVVGALGLGRLPFDAELVERLARGAFLGQPKCA
jgi:hypothetical protein